MEIVSKIKKKRRKRDILGVPVEFGLTTQDVLEKISAFAEDGRTQYAVTVNPEFVMDAQRDEEFKEILQNADLSFPDGSGLLFADCYLDKLEDIKKNIFFPAAALQLGLKCGFSSFSSNETLGERITGADLLFSICGLAERKKYSVIFIGGWERDIFGRNVKEDLKVAERTSLKLKSMFPSLKTVGGLSEFTYKKEDDEKWMNGVHQLMHEAGVDSVDIVFVAFGHRKQEKWIKRNLHRIPARFGIGVGASFDFVIGVQKRAPKFFVDLNLEWLFRLMTQPWRIKRVLKAFPVFPMIIFVRSLAK